MFLINKRTIAFGAVLTLSLGLLAYVLMYYSLAKQGFHIDEIYSYGLSNSYYLPFPTAANEWISGTYYQDYLMPAADHHFQYGSVISNQVNDVHPPLYYLLFHTVASIWPGDFSPLVGLSLNLMAHMATMIVLGLIIHLLTRNNYLSLITSLAWGLSLGGLSSLLFIRMYHLMGFFVVALLYLLLAYFRMTSKWKYLLLIPIFASIVAGSLTHYYFYIIAGLLVAVTCLALLVSKAYAGTFALGSSAAGAVVAAWAIFPAVWTHITQSSRGVEVLANANDGTLTENLLKYVHFIQEDLWANVSLVIIVGCLVLMGIILLVNSKRLLTKTAVLQAAIFTIPTVGYILFVQNLSHYQTARYIFPIYPLIVIMMILVLYYSLRNLVNKPLATALVFISTLVLLGFGFHVGTVDFQYVEQSQLQAKVDQLPHQNAMVFAQKRWQIAQYSGQIARYDQVYPMVLTSADSSALPALEEEQVGQDLTVFVSNPDLDQEQLVQSILDTYSLQSAQVIYQWKELTVYQFSP